MAKRAVFMDRDGTLIDDTGFIRRVEDVRLLPKAAQAVKRLNEADWLVIVVSNQSGVARGLLTERDVAATNQRMTELLAAEGAKVDGVYYCPHLPEGSVPNYARVCDCRKPRPGLLLEAAREHDIDLAHSVMIGDAPRDAEAGIAAGTHAILLTSSPARADQAPDACGQAPDVFAAVTEVLKMSIVETRPRTRKKSAAKKKAAPETPPAEAEEETPDEPVDTTPEQKAPAADEESVIPIRRAHKEFTPEPEVEPEPEKTPAPAESTEAPAEAPVEAKTHTAPEAAPEAAHATPVRCGRCDALIDPVDLETGRALDRHGVKLCADCLATLRTQDVSTREVTNEDLLRELKNVTRALTYEKFSTWHILGGLMQGAALAMLVIAFLQHSAPEGLLYAVFFQLMAMTFFILGRQ